VRTDLKKPVCTRRVALLPIGSSVLPQGGRIANRRDFLAGGAAFATLAITALRAGPVQARALARPFNELVSGPLLIVYDRRLLGSDAFAADAAASGYSPLGFDSDIAALWMHEIEPRLRVPPLAIAGFTSSATLFCLELLARDYGAQALRRIEQHSSATPRLTPLMGAVSGAVTAPLEPVALDAGQTGVSWLIATDRRRRAPLAAPTTDDSRG